MRIENQNIFFFFFFVFCFFFFFFVRGRHDRRSLREHRACLGMECPRHQLFSVDSSRTGRQDSTKVQNCFLDLMVEINTNPIFLHDLLSYQKRDLNGSMYTVKEEIFIMK